jgi:hypothetical protein
MSQNANSGHRLGGDAATMSGTRLLERVKAHEADAWSRRCRVS